MPTRETLATFEMMDADYDLDAYSIGSEEPRCVVTAGIHGDETPSIEVAETLLEELDRDELNGSVTVVPRSNVFACADNTRETPWPRYEEYESEERNLNRSFDLAYRKLQGEPLQLNLTQTIAYHLLQAIREADYLIDLHTGTWPGKKLPQVRMKDGDALDEAVVAAMERMTQHSGLEHIVRTQGTAIGSGVLAAVAPRLGVPAVTFEAGGPRHFSEAMRETYIGAVRNVLGAVDVLGHATERADATEYHGLHPVYTGTAGVLERRTSIGADVEEGDTIAKIRGEDGAVVETVTSPVQGVVEMMNQRRAVNQGIRVAKIAYTE